MTATATAPGGPGIEDRTPPAAAPARPPSPGPAASCDPAAAAFPPPPFPHGPFLVGGEGELTPTGRAALRFAWRGRRCEAWLEGGRLALSAAAGLVPYTAEAPAERPLALAALGRLAGELPAGWRLRLAPNHALRLEAEWALARPTTATWLVGALVGFVLALDPWLDQLEEAGVGAAPPDPCGAALARA